MIAYQASFGELTVCLQTDSEYSPLIADDIAAVCRRELIGLDETLTLGTEPEPESVTVLDEETK